MIGKRLSILASMFLALGVMTDMAHANVKLPSIFSDNMILQQSARTPIWGWADAGEAITVKIGEQVVTAKANEAGKWMAYLDLSKSAKGPFELTVAGRNTLTVKNVLIGQVWLASGQSNMEMRLGAAVPATGAIATAEFPEIRQFQAAYSTGYLPLADNKGNPPHWVVCAPETAANFSAVGFFFAREIHQQVGSPVGILLTSWGGTPAESWMSLDALSQIPDQKENADRIAKAVSQTTPAQQEEINKAYEQWLQTVWPVDEANTELTRDWAGADFDDSDWKTIAMPGAVENNGLDGFDGSIWFRTEFTLTDAQVSRDLFISFGTVDDFDTTYLNGQMIGKTDTDLEYSWTNFRVYRMPAKVLKVGKNVLAVRVFDRAGAGGVGVMTTSESMKVYDGTQPLFSVAGNWKYKIEKQIPTTDLGKVMGSDPRVPGFETTLFNGKIAPFMPYGLAGVIWYQGEANEERAYQYRVLFPALINDWRAQWKQAGGQEKLPFFFVQLANYYRRDAQPSERARWAVVRESQQAALKLPDTGSAQAIDLGDSPGNIHPVNKVDVGYRLALAALAQVYGKDIEYSGALFESKEIKGNQIILTFTHGKGLHAGRFKPEEKVKGFAICGADHKFVWADAVIDGQTVIVSSPQIQEPTEVRYAWANNPVANLYNEAGLPASPFRTDTFTVVTQPAENK